MSGYPARPFGAGVRGGSDGVGGRGWSARTSAWLKLDRRAGMEPAVRRSDR